MSESHEVLHAQAFAKINWDLRILGRRPDNFHELDSVFVTVGLSDALTFRGADALSLTCSDPSLPLDESNLVVKAAQALARAADVRRGAAIHLEKAIPMGGGLGGGSSDAGCALTVLNRLWELNWGVDQLGAVAAQVGSDVAFFLHGGWCLCRGRGESVERLAGSEQWPAVKLLLILPPLHVATPAVYKALGAPAWDGRGGRDVHAVSEQLRGVSQGTASGIELRNDLSAAARTVEPRLAGIQNVLQRYFPDRWLMSGSGAAHFAVPQTSAFTSMREMAEELNKAVAGTRVIETETLSSPAGHAESNR